MTVPSSFPTIIRTNNFLIHILDVGDRHRRNVPINFRNVKIEDSDAESELQQALTSDDTLQLPFHQCLLYASSEMLRALNFYDEKLVEYWETVEAEDEHMLSFMVNGVEWSLNDEWKDGTIRTFKNLLRAEDDTMMERAEIAGCEGLTTESLTSLRRHLLNLPLEVLGLLVEWTYKNSAVHLTRVLTLKQDPDDDLLTPDPDDAELETRGRR